MNDSMGEAGGKNDKTYLKNYVSEHPENKMAWYLLGREYMRKGEQGKARYCFERAGEIFQAFESPDEHALEFVHEKEEWHRAAEEPEIASNPHDSAATRNRGKTALAFLRFAIVAAWGLALLLFAPFGHHSPQDMAVEPTPSPPAASSQPPVIAADHIPQTGVIVMRSNDGEMRWGEILNRMVLQSDQDAKRMIVAKAAQSSESGWSDWTKAAEILLSTERKDTRGELTVLYHSKSVCACQLSDASSSREEIKVWKTRQEELLTLISALSAYRLDHGSFPKELGELSKDYPNNYISGSTALMEQVFQPLKRELQTDLGSGKNISSASPDPSAANPVSEEPSATVGAPKVSDGEFNLSPNLNPWEQPLEIKVDKSNHRLAVVSGQMIIRNYPVGLGGKRTPTGTFEITEKVMNPNGKSNGDFGSRGMTLSDSRYAIHGTNEPDSIGKDESLGCIRMLKDDVEELFDMVPKGTKVTIDNGGLPKEIMRGSQPFSLPHQSKQTNPNKIYHWL